MMDIMEKYANNLEELVTQRTNEVYDEKRKTEDLLHRMLPACVYYMKNKYLHIFIFQPFKLCINIQL